MTHVSYARVEMVIDFETEQDALKYIEENQGKGWRFTDPEQYDTDADANGNKWSVTIEKPYKDYNFGSHPFV